MAITRLKRKGRKNKQVAKVRRNTIKQLTAKPVITNVDVEEIKEGFKTSKKEEKPKAEAKPKTAKKEEPKAEAKPKAEKKVTAKPKATKKATEPKAEKKAAPKKKAAAKKKVD